VSSAVVAAVGGLGGLAVFAVVWALLPPPPVHTATAKGGTATAVTGPAPAGGWRQWLVARWSGYAGTRHGLLLGAPSTDLEQLGRDVPSYLSSRLGWALGGLAAPVLLAVALLVLGVDALVLQGQMYGRASLTCDDASPESRRPGISPRSSPVVLVPTSLVFSMAAALGCSLLPALVVREQARTAREEFRRAVGAYLNLIAQQRTAGASPTQAMTEAAAIADGWQFVRIRVALEHGRRRGITPWDSLRQLADRLGSTELGELADVMASASHGSAVATTLSSQAAALRTAAIAADQADANEVSERMIYPVTLLGLGFLLLLVYPAIVRLLSA